MEIISTLVNAAGEKLAVRYQDIDSASELETRIVKTVHAYCFYKNKFIVVLAGQTGMWTPPGGSVEVGESLEEAVVREVHEETNMRVIKQCLIGYQDISESAGIITQTRSVCLVEPYGEFISDPDGDITEIKLIDADSYKEFFDWGKVGDHIMEQSLIKKEYLLS
jgi:ADP-ribose pyrophosphatase YjhB (NUDIX family)